MSGAAQPVGARPLVVGYVLKMFPRFSETFILNEILALESRGVRVVAFSMKEPNEAIRQPDLARFGGRSIVVPPIAARYWRLHLKAHGACLLGSPRRYLSTLVFAARRGTDAAWRKFLQAPFIAREARALGVEHLHAHFASGPARQAKLVSLLTGIPYSFTAHAKDLYWEGHRHGKNNKLKKRIRLASFVVVISEYNRRFIEGLGFKLPRRRLITIYNGLDLDRWTFARPDGRPLAREAAPLILAVGRLVPKKGFADLIEACRLLRESGVAFRCVIAGEGPESAALRARIGAAGLDDLVELPGPVPQDRLRAELYPAAAVLAQPSVIAADGDQDGIPTVIIEALALGLPVVATPVSGIGEAVIHERTGLLAAPGDPRALAGAIERLLADDAMCARLAAGGRRLSEQRFDLKNNAKLLIHLMRHAARGDARWSVAKLRERVGLESLKGEEDAQLVALAED